MNPQLRELPVNMLQRAIINGRALPFEREEPKCESDDEEFWQSAASAAERLW
jgi:antitoxin component of RelBE/YafQ-DinJ toxin-antitoxin module